MHIAQENDYFFTYSPVNTIGASSTAGPSHDKYSSSLPDENRPKV